MPASPLALTVIGPGRPCRSGILSRVPLSRLLAQTAPSRTFRPLTPMKPVEASSGADDHTLARWPPSRTVEMVPSAESVM